jgi:hypothetical protein
MSSINTPFKEIKKEVKRGFKSKKFRYISQEFFFHRSVPLGFLQELKQTYLIGIFIILVLLI